MLLKNKSYVEKIVHIQLEYDDGTIKKGCIKKGTRMYITFRRDGELINGYGKVVDISENIHYVGCDNPIHSQIITFNMSSCFRSKEYKIKVCDIVNFMISPPILNIGPEKGKLPMPIIGRKEKCCDKERTPTSRRYCL